MAEFREVPHNTRGYHDVGERSNAQRRPNIEYFDEKKGRLCYWEATEFPGREGFLYPDTVVHAVDMERTFLLKQVREMRAKIEYLEICLRSAYGAMDRWENESRRKDLRMAAGKRKLQETCEAFVIDEEKRDVSHTSETNVAKRVRFLSTEENTPPPQVKVGETSCKRPNEQSQDMSAQKRDKQVRCRYCRKINHMEKECWKKVGKCLRCGSDEHKIKDCLGVGKKRLN